MSKAKYVEPQMDIIKFEASDIITTSGGEFDGQEHEFIVPQADNDGF